MGDSLVPNGLSLLRGPLPQVDRTHDQGLSDEGAGRLSVPRMDFLESVTGLAMLVIQRRLVPCSPR